MPFFTYLIIQSLVVQVLDTTNVTKKQAQLNNLHFKRVFLKKIICGAISHILILILIPQLSLAQVLDTINVNKKQNRLNNLHFKRVFSKKSFVVPFLTY